MAKSELRENPRAVQQSAKQLPQSGRRDCRSRTGTEDAVESFDIQGMCSSLNEFGEGPGVRGTRERVPLKGTLNHHRSQGKRAGTAASTLDHREYKNVTAAKRSIAS